LASSLSAGLDYVKPQTNQQCTKARRLPLLSISLVVIAGLAWLFVADEFGLSVFQQQKSSLLLQVGAVNGNTLGDGQIWRLLTSIDRACPGKPGRAGYLKR
jgi:hypothetical protein